MADPRGREALENEINVLRQLEHRSLLKLLEVFETENTIYLCTEYLKGGQLYHRIMVQPFIYSELKAFACPDPKLFAATARGPGRHE